MQPRTGYRDIDENFPQDSLAYNLSGGETIYLAHTIHRVSTKVPFLSETFALPDSFIADSHTKVRVGQDGKRELTFFFLDPNTYGSRSPCVLELVAEHFKRKGFDATVGYEEVDLVEPGHGMLGGVQEFRRETVIATIGYEQLDLVERGHEMRGGRQHVRGKMVVPTITLRRAPDRDSV